MSCSTPRVVIAGLAGDSGKTLVSLAVLCAARAGGLAVRAFKKGPDYIDPAWLAWASQAPAPNLDSWLMGFDGVSRSFADHAVGGLNLIEGNRGLFDGLDTQGTHSTAELAKSLGAPVILVLNVAKMTRTAAALVLGCRHLDPALWMGGVILNRVNGKRHEQVARASIEQTCGLPVVGVIPKLDSEIMPRRHLGLVTPEDYPDAPALRHALSALASGLDLERLLEIARSAPELSTVRVPQSQPRLAPHKGANLGHPEEPHAESSEGQGLKIGVIRDAACSFYYADNLRALERRGAELVTFSALTATELPPDLHALYIGGGFPEVHAARLAANAGFLRSLALAAQRGLPIFAECGGLMLLSRAIHWQGERHAMANVFPIEVEVGSVPVGHGYVELVVDSPNPFFPLGTALRGHEFHYSGIKLEGQPPPTACAVRRGAGAYPGRDALLTGNVWASYTHLHALGTPLWAPALIAAARRSSQVKLPARVS